MRPCRNPRERDAGEAWRSCQIPRERYALAAAPTPRAAPTSAGMITICARFWSLQRSALIHLSAAPVNMRLRPPLPIKSPAPPFKHAPLAALAHKISRRGALKQPKGTFCCQFSQFSQFGPRVQLPRVRVGINLILQRI